MRRYDLSRLVPPGADPVRPLAVICVLWVLAAIELTARFAVYFPIALGALPEFGGSAYVELPLLPPSFSALMGTAFTRGIFLPVRLPPLMGTALAIYLLALGLGHAQSFTRGSRADYTMRRLPDRGALRRRTWGLPILGLAGLIILYFCIVLLCWKIYGLYLPG